MINPGVTPPESDNLVVPVVIGVPEVGVVIGVLGVVIPVVPVVSEVVTVGTLAVEPVVPQTLKVEGFVDCDVVAVDIELAVTVG